MNRLIIALLFIFTFQTNAGSVEDPYTDIVRTKLNNGMKVYLLADKAAVNTQIQLTVDVGWDVETPDNYGLSHLVEHVVFRDRRVPHREYVDHIKEEGATSMNGYTDRYETGYYATINSEKSYWIAEAFASMLFDKEVEEEDLKSERGAVQTEIGAPQWLDKPFWFVAEFFHKVFPVENEIYQSDFALSKASRPLPDYKEKTNNQKFTMQQVMQHYQSYYYPANMTLKIAGNFNTEKMRVLIQKYYGSIIKTGTQKAQLLPSNPSLNHKPYRRFYERPTEHYGYIGAKYVLDDYKKHLILEAYTENLADRLQQNLRNERGDTYSINAYNFGDRKARIASVSFDGLHEQFENNIETIYQTIEQDKQSLSAAVIDQALKSYKKRFTTIEHNSGALMSLIDTAEYLHEKHKTEQTAYEFFDAITHDEFKDTLKDVFVGNNMYSDITRGYYLFPYDFILLWFTSIASFMVVYFKQYQLDSLTNSTPYLYKEITLSMRISNRFLAMLYFLLIMLIVTVIWAWIGRLFYTYFMGDANWSETIDVPYNYLWYLVDQILWIVFFVVLCRYVFSYHARLDVTKQNLFLVGHRIDAIPRAQITAIRSVKWSIGKSTKSVGISLLFWRPLVEIKMKKEKTYYIRSRYAEHIADKLNNWLMQ